MWFGEYRRLGQIDEAENWRRASMRARSTQERAKADCKRVLEDERNNAHRLEFRIVADDRRATICQESRPPHGSRLRWVNAV